MQSTASDGVSVASGKGVPGASNVKPWCLHPPHLRGRTMTNPSMAGLLTQLGHDNYSKSMYLLCGDVCVCACVRERVGMPFVFL